MYYVEYYHAQNLQIMSKILSGNFFLVFMEIRIQSHLDGH